MILTKVLAEAGGEFFSIGYVSPRVRLFWERGTSSTDRLASRSRDVLFLCSVQVLCFLLVLVALGRTIDAQTPAIDEPSLTYLDEFSEPYYPGTHFPKLITPQWVGEEGVDAVVTLAIDDMRDPAKYEAYLRPILEHLKKIDGRAPVSIMTCSVEPNDPQVQSWLNEGLSIEVHTVDHPCPCLQGGQFAEAKSTYDRCVDTMASIPGNQPVAFRTPCCDSRNTPSPRLWSEIFNQTTEQGNFLQADSSVFNVFTSSDPQLPSELVTEADGTPRMKKYIPFPSFVNTIENYPYPYVIGKLCWQFPCMVPSDWEAQNLHQPNNPKTVEDMKAALDATVIKQGMFNLVFHPHGWIRNDQVIELIQHARDKYGDRVKFLTFKECIDRINKHLLVGHPLRAPSNGRDNGVRILDMNRDGFLDVLIGNEHEQTLRIWEPDSLQWQDTEHGITVTTFGPAGRIDRGVRIGRLNSDANVSLFVNHEEDQSIYEFSDSGLARQPIPELLSSVKTSSVGTDQGVRLRDLDGDGLSEIIVANDARKEILKVTEDGNWVVHAPFPYAIVDQDGQDNGVRFVDFDHDGYDDLIISNESVEAICLYDSSTGSFSRVVDNLVDLPLIVRDGTNNGAWFVRNHMWVQNEDTHRLPDGVDRRSFEELLGQTEPGPRSPQDSLNSIQLRPGFEIELVAAEPMVMDPIAIDWGPDGKLWVVEMADYPLGLDDRGKPGGRVRYLEDTDGDGRYDQSTLFLDNIAYPTGVIAWRDGVIVSAAPTVFFAADRDGDGKAEVREDLYQGFGEGNQQHRVNGFERGLDNWLYLANGDSGGSVESLKTGDHVELGGQDLRIRPDDGALDLQTGRTQFGRHRDDHGNWFGCSNPLPVIHFVLADHYLRRNPLVAIPSARQNIARVDNTQLFPVSRVLSHWSGYKPPGDDGAHRFTSACSTMVYRDDLFGSEFQQNTFTCEPVHNAVHRRRLVPTGVSFDSVRPDEEAGVEFLASADSWFRPASVTTGPDGAIWVVDMYRLVIEHPEWIDDETEKKLFLRAGYDRGRIYRIYPSDKKPRQIEALGHLQSTQLVHRLESPNGRTRDLAQQLLIHRDDKSTIKQMEQILRHSEKPLGRLHALCTLDGMNAVRSEMLETALADPNPTVRRHAIRISETIMRQADKDLSNLLAALCRCDATDPHVQLQLAYSLGESTSSIAVKRLAELAIETATDPYLHAAIMSSLDASKLGDFYQYLSNHPETLELYRPAVLEMAARLENTSLVSQLIDDLIKGIDLSKPALEQLDNLRQALVLLNRHEVKLEKATQSQIARLNDVAFSMAHDHSQASSRRVAAIKWSAITGKQADSLLELLNATEPTDIQIAVAESLAADKTQEVLSHFEELSPSVRSAILEELLRREKTAMSLVQALQQEQISLQDISPNHRQRLTGHPSQQVRSMATQLFHETQSSSPRVEIIANYENELVMPGNHVVGGELFLKHCASCHQLNGIGHAVGPDLKALKNRSPRALLTAILDPGSAVEDKFRSYSILTVDGIAETGIIAGESSTAIELLLPEGKTKSILRSDIELIRSSGKSLMPEEMEKSISPKQMRDLLSFLEDTTTPARQFEGNHPITVVASNDGSIQLDATTCRIYGEQIRFEPQYRNIGYWGGSNDYVQWIFEVTRAGRYDVVLEYACPDNTAGNRYQFNCSQQTLVGTVPGTGNWDEYKEIDLGSIQLQEGTASAVLAPTDGLNQWLMDLKSITLRPTRR